MRALTLKQPWASAIVRKVDPKLVENRTTLLPPAELLEFARPYFAIHAGLSYDLAWPFPQDALVPPPEDCPLGAVIGVARVPGALDTRGPRRRVLGCDAVPPIFRPKDPTWRRIDALESTRWWLGPIGWLLTDIVAIEPVPCRGQLGCWTLPPAVEAEVRTRLDVVRARSAT